MNLGTGAECAFCACERALSASRGSRGRALGQAHVFENLMQNLPARGRPRKSTALKYCLELQ